MKKGEIKSFSPFLATYKSYEGHNVNVSFKCQNCGSKNCERKNKNDGNYFFQGNFKCKGCGNNDVNYYSNCFIKNNAIENKQLTLLL